MRNLDLIYQEETLVVNIWKRRRFKTKLCYSIVSITVYETYINHNLLAVSVILGCMKLDIHFGEIETSQFVKAYKASIEG